MSSRRYSSTTSPGTPCRRRCARVTRRSMRAFTPTTRSAMRSARMSQRELMSRHPDLMSAIAALPQVALVMARDGEQDVFMCGGDEHRGDQVKRILAPYDDPDILFEQLSRLNSFQNAGDVVVF